MKAKDIDYLRQKAVELGSPTIKLETIAEILQISLRTLNSWKSNKNYVIPRAYDLYLRNFFEPLLISQIISEIRDIVEKAYEIVPSEICMLRIVVDNQLILHRDSIRYQDLNSKEKNVKPIYLNQTTLIPVNESSMTTYPLQTGRIINLAGIDILNHHSKKTNNLLSSNRREADTYCHSVIHIPWCMPLLTGGGKPICLLTLENKLDKNDGTVINTIDNNKNNQFKNRIFKDSADRLYVYNYEEVDKLQHLLRQSFSYNEKSNSELFSILSALGYYN